VSRFCHGANDWIRHVAGNICCCANGWRYVSFPQHKSLESPPKETKNKKVGPFMAIVDDSPRFL
jgi:hypothetical protein